MSMKQFPSVTTTNSFYALGSFLGVDSTDGVYTQSMLLRETDLTPCPVALFWDGHAKLLKKGIITEEQTILPLKMGEYVNLAKAVDYIAQKSISFILTWAK